MKAHRQQGFTLIELLIAMTVAAVIAALSYQAVDQVVTTKQSSEENIERFQQVQRAIWWLEQDLTQLAPRAIKDGYGELLPAYQYTTGFGVEFTRIAVYPSPYGISGLVRVGYQLEGDVLYRVIWPVVDRAPDTQPIRLPVLDKVSFFEIRQLNNQNLWQLVWPDEQEQQITDLPVLTEVRIELEDLGEIRRLFPGVDGMPDLSQPQEKTS